MHCSKQDGQVRACKASINRSSDGLPPSPWHMLSHLSIQEKIQRIVLQISHFCRLKSVEVSEVLAMRAVVYDFSDSVSLKGPKPLIAA